MILTRDFNEISKTFLSDMEEARKQGVEQQFPFLRELPDLGSCKEEWGAPYLNCYNFSANFKKRIYLQPGELAWGDKFPELPGDSLENYAAVVIKNLLEDGHSFLGSSFLGASDLEFPAALFFGDSFFVIGRPHPYDFHFIGLRKNNGSGGVWAHKQGELVAEVCSDQDIFSFARKIEYPYFGGFYGIKRKLRYKNSAMSFITQAAGRRAFSLFPAL